MKPKQTHFPLFLLGALIWALPVVVQAQYNVTTNSDGSVNISRYTGSGGAVVIPTTITGRTVTSIGQFAFENDSSLTSVVIGNGVTSIGDDAFEDCSALSSITFGNGVASIGNQTFLGCTSLTDIVIPNSITNLGDYAFGSCQNLVGIYFQANAPGVENDVFENGDGEYDSSVVAYYLPGTTGWDNFAQTTSISTALWAGAFQYTASPTIGSIPLTVQFNSPSLDGGNNLITGWNWNFGDGSTSSVQNPIHVYTVGGSYATGLLATNNLGQTVAGYELLIETSPPNDNFTNRFPLTGAALGSNLGATLEPNEPNPGGTVGTLNNTTTNGISATINVTNTVTNTVWWSWTAPTNGPVSVLTYGSSMDAIIDVYTGNTLSSLVCVGSNLFSVLDADLYSYQNPQVGILNPANAGILNRVGFTASAGTNYKIQISGLNEGQIDLAVQPVALKIISVNQVSTNVVNGSVNFNAVVEIGNSGLAGSSPLQIQVLAHPGYSFDSNNSLPPATGAIPADQVLTNYDLANPAALMPGTTTNISISGVCPGPDYIVTSGSTNLGYGWGIYVVLNEQFGTNWFFLDNDLLFYGQWPSIGGVIGEAGGVIRLNPSQLISPTESGFVEWQLAPPAAVLAGAGWKLSGDSTYSTATNYVEDVTSTNALVVEFKPVAGWNLPTNQILTVLPGQITSQTGFYSVTNPVLVTGNKAGLGITGTTGTVYTVQTRTSLTSGNWVTLSTNTIATNGFNLVLPKPATNVPAFYRAMWLGR